MMNRTARNYLKNANPIRQQARSEGAAVKDTVFWVKCSNCGAETPSRYAYDYPTADEAEHVHLCDDCVDAEAAQNADDRDV